MSGPQPALWAFNRHVEHARAARTARHLAKLNRYLGNVPAARAEERRARWNEKLVIEFAFYSELSAQSEASS